MDILDKIRKLFGKDNQPVNQDRIDMLKQAREAMQQQQDYIESLQAAPKKLGRSLFVMGHEVLVHMDGGLHLLNTNGKIAKPGSLLQMVEGEDGLKLIGPAHESFSALSGTVAVVEKSHGSWAIVSQDGRSMSVSLGSLSAEPGDRLVVDGLCAVRNMGKPDSADHVFDSVSGIGWDDIGGLREAKEELREAVEMPLAHPDLFKAYGKRSVRGVLLWGPPGCGKTRLAKACAASVGRAAGGAGMFLYVKGPELLDMWVGRTEAAIRGLFASCRARKAETGITPVLFIDEADAVLGRRGSGISSDIERTIVPQFLAEMDGLDEHGAMVLLATNRPDTLDPAIVREGRIDRKIEIGRPEKPDAEEIASIHFKARPFDRKAFDSAREMASRAVEIVFSDDLSIEGGPLLRDVVSGAMLEEMAERSSSSAIRRDIAKGSKKPSGIGEPDLMAAARSLARHQRGVSFSSRMMPSRRA